MRANRTEKLASLGKSGELTGPGGRALSEFSENRVIGFAGTFEDMKAVVGRVDDVERREVSEAFEDRTQELEIRERVARALQKGTRAGHFAALSRESGARLEHTGGR